MTGDRPAPYLRPAMAADLLHPLLGASRRDRDDVPWYRAPIPHRWHRCRPWSSGTVGGSGGLHVDRCACGAASLNGGPWLDRNTRRRP